MIPAPNRPWFRFSLRKMFVVVTLFACWLGYELNWIQQRHLFLARQQTLQEDAWPAEMKDQRDKNVRWWKTQLELNENRTSPGLLWIFGEEAVGTIWVSIPKHDIKIALAEPRPRLEDIGHQSWVFSRTQPDFQKAMRLFPEAKVYAFIWDEEIPPVYARAMLELAESFDAETQYNWSKRNSVSGVTFKFRQRVMVIAGTHKGKTGELVSLHDLDPEPMFHMETPDSGDILVRQSEIELIEAES